MQNKVLENPYRLMRENLVDALVKANDKDEQFFPKDDIKARNAFMNGVRASFDITAINMLAMAQEAFNVTIKKMAEGMDYGLEQNPPREESKS